MNGYNFTERVRKVLAMSREEASRLGHEYVGTEHMLLGIMREGEGVAAAVLQSRGIDAEEVIEAIEATVKKAKGTQGTGPDLPYTSRAKKVLEFAMSEARELNHSYVGTEHLLLGILREEKGIAAQVLREFGLTTEQARAEVLRLLGTEPVTQSRTLGIEADEGAMVAGAGRFRRKLRQRGGRPSFSERLTRVLERANAEVLSRRQEHVRTEHLLYALLQESDGLAAALMDRIGVDRAALAAAAAAAIGGSPQTEPTIRGDAPFSILAEAAFRRAIEDAQARGPELPGTDHLLLGLLQAQEGVALQLLSAAGLTADAVRDARNRLTG